MTSQPDRPADSPRWRVAEAVSEAVRRRFGAQVSAIGVHGPLAHGDDTDLSHVELVVVTYRPDTGPRPGRRRIDGVVVDLGVIGAQEYLQHARTLSTSWPLAADQYLTTAAMHDPDGWHRTLRDTHLARLAEATGREFATLAREAWLEARMRHDQASRLAEWYDTDGAVLVLGEARTAVAVVEGLLHRTYFRGSADAVRRAGLGDADIITVRDRLTAQAEELAHRGRPVDGSIADLLS
ncbi:MAG: nucleotidyltransferase domain-containing protein [Actinocatenispora sp.]